MQGKALRLCGSKRKALQSFAGRRFACKSVSHKCDFKSLPTLFFIMDILDSLLAENEWLAFFNAKVEAGHLREDEQKKLENFISSSRYEPLAGKLLDGGVFSVPELVKINKRFSSKKRQVFVFPEEENFIQKFLSNKLLDYDGLFADNLYSFRKGSGVKKAFSSLLSHPDLKNLYSYKLDISDYFGSVDASLLLPRLKQVLEGEERLYRLIEAMLRDEFALADGEMINVKKGILAGSPLSGFLANLYLSELDFYFQNKGVLYARYSDDIIVFAESEDKLSEYKKHILCFLKEHSLSVNESKEFIGAPGEMWTFLGFSYRSGAIDIAPVSVKKIKKKMKRKARALARWRAKKGLPPESAVRAFIKHFNRKFFDNPNNHELTWCRWYFPIINSTEGLAEIDSYMQHTLRVLATGKQTKARFNFRYERMKELGYRPLVKEFYSAYLS